MDFFGVEMLPDSPERVGFFGFVLRANTGWSNCRTERFGEGISPSRYEPFAPIHATGSNNS